jgi:hypothetical protein
LPRPAAAAILSLTGLNPMDQRGKMEQTTADGFPRSFFGLDGMIGFEVDRISD